MESNILKSKRIKYLKDTKKLANLFLVENERSKPNAIGWKRKVIENNIFQLKDIIKKLNKKCSEKMLQEYVDFELKLEGIIQNPNRFEIDNDFTMFWMEKFSESSFPLKLIQFSVSYSTVYDLHWIEDGTIEDHVTIAIGTKSPTILGQFLKNKIEFTEKEVLPYLKNDEKYKLTVSVFQAAINESNQEAYLPSNILLITGIESLVRLLGKFVYSNQNPFLSEQEVDAYIFNKFQSLESLISKGDWKEDIFISLVDAVLMNEFFFDTSLQKAEEKRRRHVDSQKTIKEKFGEVIKLLQIEQIENNGDESLTVIKEKLAEVKNIADHNMVNFNDKIIGISFRTKLQFLTRRYREDRNQLIHGSFPHFNFEWKNYIYFSALQKVFRLIKEYNEKYEMR